jgi:hypothetical protein
MNSSFPPSAVGFFLFFLWSAVWYWNRNFYFFCYLFFFSNRFARWTLGKRVRLGNATAKSYNWTTCWSHLVIIRALIPLSYYMTWLPCPAQVECHRPRSIWLLVFCTASNFFFFMLSHSKQKIFENEKWMKHFSFLFNQGPNRFLINGRCWFVIIELAAIFPQRLETLCHCYAIFFLGRRGGGFNCPTLPAPTRGGGFKCHDILHPVRPS